jgi:hypothetical protein
MTKVERNKAKSRVEALNSRLNAVQTLTENMSDKGGIEMLNIINEIKAEIATLEELLATRFEFLFNFKSGGWNSEMAFTKEEAIEQAIFKYGHPDTQEMLQVDTTTFRVSTTVDHRNLMSMFN